MYCYQDYSSLMKANDGLRGPLFGQLIVHKSIPGPLCLCCVPNMICTCLLLCSLSCWAWAALSGGLCQNRDLSAGLQTLMLDLHWSCCLTGCLRLILVYCFVPSRFLPSNQSPVIKIENLFRHFPAGLGSESGGSTAVSFRMAASDCFHYQLIF